MTVNKRLERIWSYASTPIVSAVPSVASRPVAKFYRNPSNLPKRHVARPGFIYATLLPNGAIKVGRSYSVKRATAAQTYHIEECRVLRQWSVADTVLSEREAHKALAQYRSRGELFVGGQHAIVEVIDRVVVLAGTISK